MARLRLAVFFALIAGGIAAGWGLGGVDLLRPENVRLFVEEAGAFGLVLFCCLCVVGQVLYVPGLVFITAAAWLYGPSLGGPLALVGATLAVSVHFAFVRLVGGQPLVEVRSRILRYGLRRIERRPLFAVGLLRLLFMTSPPLTAALALGPVSFRDHLSGSFIGMTPQVLEVAFVVEALR